MRAREAEMLLPCTCLHISRRAHSSPCGVPKIPEHVQTRNHIPLRERGREMQLGAGLKSGHKEKVHWLETSQKVNYTCRSWSAGRTPGRFRGSSWSWGSGGTGSRTPPGPLGYEPCRSPRSEPWQDFRLTYSACSCSVKSVLLDMQSLASVHWPWPLRCAWLWGGNDKEDGFWLNEEKSAPAETQGKSLLSVHWYTLTMWGVIIPKPSYGTSPSACCDCCGVKQTATTSKSWAQSLPVWCPSPVGGILRQAAVHQCS